MMRYEASKLAFTWGAVPISKQPALGSDLLQDLLWEALAGLLLCWWGKRDVDIHGGPWEKGLAWAVHTRASHACREHGYLLKRESEQLPALVSSSSFLLLLGIIIKGFSDIYLNLFECPSHAVLVLFTIYKVPQFSPFSSWEHLVSWLQTKRCCLFPPKKETCWT